MSTSARVEGVGSSQSITEFHGPVGLPIYEQAPEEHFEEENSASARQRQVNAAERHRLVPGLAKLKKQVRSTDAQGMRRLLRHYQVPLKELRNRIAEAESNLAELGQRKTHMTEAFLSEAETFESWQCFELVNAFRTWSTHNLMLVDHITLLELTRAQLYRIVIEDIEEGLQILKSSVGTRNFVVLPWLPNLDVLNSLHFVRLLDRRVACVQLIERVSFRRFLAERSQVWVVDQDRRCAQMRAILSAPTVSEDDGFAYFPENESLQRRFDDLVLDVRCLLGKQLQHFVEVLQREQQISPIDVVDFVESFVESVAVNFHVARTDRLTLFTHRCILSKVFPLCWPCEADRFLELERRFVLSRELLRKQPPATLDPLLESYYAAKMDFGLAIEALEELSYCLVPVDMIYCIKKAMQLLSDSAQAALAVAPAADDLLPLLMHTLVLSQLPLVHQSYDFMEQFASFDHKMGMFGYALTTFQAALSHITDFKHQQQP